MVAFGVYLSNVNKEILTFFKDTNERLNKGSPYGKLFEGYIKKINKNIFVINMSPLVPRVYFISYYLLGIITLLNSFNIFNLWNLIPLIIYSTKFFYSRYLILFMLNMAFKKNKFNCKINTLKDTELINLLVKEK